MSFAVIAVFDRDGNPYCPESDAIVRAVQGTDRNYTLMRRPGVRAERGGDGRIVSLVDAAGCNQYSSGDSFAYCRPATLTADVEIPGCGSFDETIGWLENYGMGENGISWVVGVDVDCPRP